MFRPLEVIKRFCSCCNREAAEIDEKNKYEKIENRIRTVALVDMKTPDTTIQNGIGGREMSTEISVEGNDSEDRAKHAPDRIRMLEYLLPFKCDTKPTLVLDLDQTLVYSTFEMPRCYDFGIRIPNNPSAVIYVKLRPHVARFIDVIGVMYEIVVFTAARKEYAQKVISEIDKDGVIKHILYRDSCTLFDGKYIKDLSRLGRPLTSVILVDDIPYSYKLQPRNGVHIPPYTGDENDDALLELMRFLQRLPRDEDFFDHIVQAPFKANITG